MRWLFAAFGGFRVGFLVLLVLLVVYLSTTVVPAGHVGVQDFFGRVSDRILSPGINLIVPGTSSSSACRRGSSRRRPRCPRPRGSS